MTIKEAYKADMLRYGFHPNMEMKWFHFFFRSAQYSNCKLIHYISRLLLILYCRKRGLTLSWRTSIGKGFYMGHPFGITINEAAVLGENINIHKGATIGQQNRGMKAGSPKIGNNVWIGINAVIVGNVKIGNDVLIAPNSYVNFDIPDHSIVFGNPARIKHNDNATKGYLNNCC